jgi:hypothetical protein
MAGDYLELFLKWAPGGENPDVKAWLAKHDLSVMRMTNGLLVSGSRPSVEKAFSVSLQDVQGSFEVPVPDELKSHVASITLPGPRSYHR